MKELLNLCAKSIHFAFNSNIYVQNDGVAMGLPLGPVLADIFMVELQRISNTNSNGQDEVLDKVC